MARVRKVVVQGGGKNLYEIGESGGTFHVRKVTPGPLRDNRTSLGSTSSLEDALSIIRSHSGREIEKIRDMG